MTIAEVQPVTKIKIIIINVNVMDVNVTTRSNAIEEQMFKDRDPRKTKNAIDWEKEE
jgi:hypothetical protein